METEKPASLPGSLSIRSVHFAGTHEKEAFLYAFSRQYRGRTLVFFNSISPFFFLFSFLGVLKSVYALLSQLRVPVLRIYSGMQQKQRIQHLNRFRSLADALLLATDVAARGLDLPAVHTVLHFHLPPTPVIFVHRCGRTARGGTRGLAIAMVAAGEKKIYREICEFCGRANGFAGFPVGAAVSPAVIRCVGIAREIAKEVAAATKIDRDADWLRKSAEEADLEVEETGETGETGETEVPVRLSAGGKKRIRVEMGRRSEA